MIKSLSITRFIQSFNKRSLSDARSKSFSLASVATATQIILATLPLYSQNATWRSSTANTDKYVKSVIIFQSRYLWLLFFIINSYTFHLHCLLMSMDGVIVMCNGN